MLVYWEEIDDELGDGFRLFTEEDAVYESRILDDTLTAAYRDSEDWNAKVRFPLADPDDAEQAYKTYADLAHRIEDEYDTDLSLTVKAFNDQLQDGTVSNDTNETALHYHPEPQLDIAPRRLKRLASSAPGAAGYTLVGKIYGGGLGMAVGTLGGLGALIGGTPDLLAPMAGGGLGLGVAFGGAGGGMVAKDYYHDKFPADTIKRRRYRNDPDHMLTLLTDVNRLHHLNEKLEVADTYVQDDVDAYESLRNAAPDEDMDLFLDLFFHDLHKRQGITTTFTTDSYDHATDFITHVTETPDREMDEPSIHTNPNAYINLLDWTTYQTNDVEPALLPTGEQLIRTALQHDDLHPDIDHHLTEHYGEHVDRIGIEEL